MPDRQLAWVLGGLLLGAIIWIVLRTIAYIQGHNHVVLTAAAFVLIGGLLGWVGAKIFRIK
jgi:hypothetical protein